MGAMLVGMATGFAFWAFALVLRTLLTVVLFINAHKNNMKAAVWAVATVLFGFWTLLFYIGVRIKISKSTCPSCGCCVRANESFCMNCGTGVKRIDDGAIVKKFILVVFVIMAIATVIGAAMLMVIT